MIHWFMIMFPTKLDIFFRASCHFQTNQKKGRSATCSDRKPTQSPGASIGELWGIKTNRWCSSTISVDVPQRKLGSKRQNPGAFRQKRRQSTLWQFNIAMEIHHHPRSSDSMGHLYHTKWLNWLPPFLDDFPIETSAGAPRGQRPHAAAAARTPRVRRCEPAGDQTRPIPSLG